jgi:hypothetical protein
MTDFERALLDDASIPFTDAADFYLGIRKAAEAPPEVQDAARKGVLSGITQSTKDAIVDRAHRGERTGRAVGQAVGTIGGAVAGHKLLKGHAGALVGGALGYATGGSAGKEVGRGRDIARHKHAAVRMRFKLACMKLAEEPMAEMGGAMTSPTAGQELQPVNYLQAEQMAQQAQNAQEGAFYRARAQQAEQMAQSVQEQMAQVQQQLQDLQMQVEPSMQEALAARDDALKQTQVAANLRLGMQKLRQQMLEVASQDPAEVAAAELQGQQAQMAAAPQDGDPAAAGGAPPASPSEAGKEVQEAGRAQDEAAIQTSQAQQAAGAPQPQGSPALGAAPGPSGGADLGVMDPTAGLKQGAVSPQLIGAGVGAGVGALTGGLSAYRAGLGAPELRSRVQAMEAQEQGGFRQAMQLAALKGRLAGAEVAEQHPTAATAYGALTGAVGGAAVGASAGPSIGRIANHLRPLG